MAVHSPALRKTIVCGAQEGPSMIQATRATASQQLNSMLNAQITTSTQGTVLQTNTGGFSWSRDTQL